MGDSGGDGVTRWLSHGFQGLQRSGSMRRLELISGLRTRGIGDHVNLPQLVVSGDQSTGKSSVLEGITGLPFPRQDGLCTRFATEITTEHTDITSLEITASIIPAIHRDGKVYDHLRAYERTLNSLDELPAVIAEVGELMGLKGYGSREAGPAFGQDVLRINVRGKTGLNLTVVDLPGIIQVPNEEQDDSDVETIHGLVDTYAANPGTIILAVVQAGNDIANQPIIQKSKKFDKAGERTIGVITKPDLINDKTQSRIAALAKNEDTTKLQLGFFLVKNPSPSELEAGINPQERERMELCYFASPPWKDQGLERSRTGVIALRTYLQDLLDRHTERELPKVREEVRKLLKSTGKSIESLGEERPDVEQMRMFLSRLAMRFHNITRSALIGDYDSAEPDFFFLDSEHPVRLRALVHTLNHHFSNEMRIRGETLKVAGEHDDSSRDDIDIHDHLRDGNCSEQLPVTEENFADWVKKTYSRTRGRELPGNYNHVLLAELFHSQSKRWAALSFQHVDKVYEQIKTFVKASVEHVARDERVRLEVYEKVNQRLDNNMSSAKAELGRLLEDGKQQPITYNHYYTDNVQKARRDTSQDLIETVIKDTATEEYHGAMHISNNGLDLGRLLAALKRRVTVDMDDQACTEARAGLKAYYKVARKTFVDNVCKQVIERHLLQPLPGLFSPAAVAGYRDDELIRIAAESPQVSSERRRLQDLQANLMTSLAELG